jgi:hypothetical protein
VCVCVIITRGNIVLSSDNINSSSLPCIAYYNNKYLYNSAISDYPYIHTTSPQYYIRGGRSGTVVWLLHIIFVVAEVAQ